MPAFQAAADAGAAYFELDVHLSRDGEIVVHHDPHFGRTCGRPDSICESTWAQITELDAGYGFSIDAGRSFPARGRGIRVPRLAEVLAAFRQQRILIEIKQEKPSLVDPLVKLIDRSGVRKNVAIASELQQPIDQVRALAPDLPTNLPYFEIVEFMQALAARNESYRPRGNALQVPPEYEGWKLAIPEIIEYAHLVGLVFDVWTVNEEAEMRSLLDAGVDGIITDYPARALKVIGSR